NPPCRLLTMLDLMKIRRTGWNLIEGDGQARVGSGLDGPCRRHMRQRWEHRAYEPQASLRVLDPGFTPRPEMLPTLRVKCRIYALSVEFLNFPLRHRYPD
ncbi:MAG: hypothetical protein M1600_08565, partial [Firmicutes bacterium]|nr:hypothetical protein [Bacillota bacterium]